MRPRPELKEIVAEASRALARLDGARLEELAQCCDALNSEIASVDLSGHAALSGEAHDAVRGMAVFARVLTATRANVEVMNRLRELRAGRQEYCPQTGRQWTPTKERRGDD